MSVVKVCKKHGELTHIKLGLETEFYQEAIKYMRENKK